MNKMFGLLMLPVMGSLPLFAQPVVDLEQLKKNYPNARSIILQEEQHIKIELKKEGLVITGQSNTQRLFLSDKIAASNEFSLPYTPGFMEIDEVDAFTYVPEGTKYKKMVVKDIEDKERLSEDVFYGGGRYKHFYFPGLTYGAIAEYNYSTRYLNPFFTGSFYFKNYAPTLHSKYTVTVPAGVKIQYRSFGDTTDLQLTIEQKKNNTVYSWEMKEQKEMKYYDNAVSSQYYQPHVYVFIEEYQKKDGTEKVYGTVSDLYNFNYGLIKKVNTGAPDAHLQFTVDSIIKISPDTGAVVKNIYYWAQDHIKYIAVENGWEGFVPREANDVYVKKWGDCKDFASIISTMLKMAKLPGRMVWIGTRDIPYSLEEMATISCFNHMIAAIHLNGKWHFLDGTSQHTSWTRPSAFIQDKDALIELGPDSFLVEKVPVQPAASNVSESKVEIKITESGFEGKVQTRYTGYVRSGMLDRLYYTSKHKLDEKIKDMLSFGNQKCNIISYSHSDFSQRDSALVFDYTFDLKDNVRKIDNELFVNPYLNRLHQDMKIDTTGERKITHEFPFKYTSRFTNTYLIPEGYKVKQVSPSVSYSNDKFSYSIEFKKINNTIVLNYSFIVNVLTVESKDFNTWNSEMDKIVNNYKNYIVLEKI
jgi:hypothetical protein